MTSPMDAATLFKVDGVVAFITGAGSGIGTMFAKALAQNGAKKVYIGGRRLEKLQEVAASLGDNVVPVQCDVTSKEDIKKAAEFIEQDSGYLNLLVCNAGITGAHPGEFSPDISLEEFADRHFALDWEAYTDPFRVNAMGAWYTTMAILKLLDKGNKQGNVRQSSQVIVTSSIAGYAKTIRAGAAYGQAKAAANAIIKQLSKALPPYGIRVNGIAPGFFPSEMSHVIIGHLQKPDGTWPPVPKTWIPEGRLGEEQDMGGCILYLASVAGAYCNGNIIVADGGLQSQIPSTF